jgi:hypothetical protein
MMMMELGDLVESDWKGTQAGRFALAMLKAVGEGRPMGWLVVRWQKSRLISRNRQMPCVGGT